MTRLYITEQQAILRKTGDRLIVEKDHTVLMEVPCLKLDAVLIYGNVQITTQAMVELLQHGIELAIFSRTGKLWGQMTPPKARNVVLRMRQYELERSEDFCLCFARSIVRGKIANAVAVLRRFRANHPGAFPLSTVEDLESRLNRVDSCPSLDTLLGVEGSAAAAYFEAFAAMVPQELGFSGRQRRPPRDPVNAILSFGYVLVGNELQSLLDGIGFDPYIGFFHRLDYGRPSLALDLVEEFRPPSSIV
jgi:CRISPR-associated protein Cas1